MQCGTSDSANCGTAENNVAVSDTTASRAISLRTSQVSGHSFNNGHGFSRIHTDKNNALEKSVKIRANPWQEITAPADFSKLPAPSPISPRAKPSSKLRPHLAP